MPFKVSDYCEINLDLCARASSTHREGFRDLDMLWQLVREHQIVKRLIENGQWDVVKAIVMGYEGGHTMVDDPQ